MVTLMLLISATEAGLYRWVDDEGNVHYSDTIPPAQVEKEHTEISKKGIRINTVPRAKTLEELRAEQELEWMRAQQERLIEEQKAADQMLLETFRSEDDIVMARDGKLEAVDVKIAVTKTNIRRQQQYLASLRSHAANLERTGKPVPKELVNNIAKAEQAIRDSYAIIVDREAEKNTIRAVFEKDLERFLRIKNLTDSWKPQATGESRPILHNIVTCRDAAECDRLWSKATTYVREHATTPVQSSGPKILITAPPTREHDISLVLSRISGDKGGEDSLFLDLQCHDSLPGQEMCKSPEAKGIINGFRPALTGEAASED